MYQPQEIEKEILSFWEREKIFDKLRKKNKGKKKWSFIDGPITANNSMGVHHAWGRTYKDVFQRFKAMQGYDQRFQNGFDCQGLWVEREEEKDLGLKNKQDIEKFGVLKFVQACKARVEKFSKIQRDQSIRLGQWMDWDNSYYTMSDKNNLHNWYLLKEYFKKGMLFKGHDSVPWCWRCGTASSKHDITTEGYKEVTHTALFMQFPLKENPEEYFLIFTTTPWTVPVNVALAVNANIEYFKVENKGGKYWIAASRVKELEGDYTVLEKKKGKALEGKEYLMPYQNMATQASVVHKVVLWDLASEEEGTGIVHIAPGCGAEDFDLGKKIGLPSPSPLNEAGIYKEEFGEFSMHKYSEVNKMVLADLDRRRFTYKTQSYRHRYPHCWRCGEELVFRLVDEWYIKCTPQIRKILVKENEGVDWFPKYGKKRQAEWFKNMGDWLISRKRYWGLPLPIWECSCGHLDVIGSMEELRKKAVSPKKVDTLPELHRPWIDEIKIRCEKCDKEVSRILDVGDAWLDAGIVPFSTLDYLEDKKFWKVWFPADFICENMPGQYRGWFNALYWTSGMLTGKAPMKAILGYETVKDEKGQEMHKSKGNAIWFDDAVNKMGADPMRLLYCLQDPAQELRFGFVVAKESKNALTILSNLSNLISAGKVSQKQNIEDKWILSKLHSLIKKITHELENHHPHLATRELQNFWLNDLSRGYVQLIRDRIADDDPTALSTLNEAYCKLLQLAAPIIPFLAEKLWQDLYEKKIVSQESVHLSSWPKAESRKINEPLEQSFSEMMKVIELGMAERDKVKIGLRWPLAKATITSKTPLNKELQSLIQRQLNVKSVKIKEGKEVNIALDTTITPELEAEGFARELARKIQSERKKAGLVKTQMITLFISCDAETQRMLDPHIHFLSERTKAKKVNFTDDKSAINLVSFEIKNKKIHFSFS